MIITILQLADIAAKVSLLALTAAVVGVDMYYRYVWEGGK